MKNASIESVTAGALESTEFTFIEWNPGPGLAQRRLRGANSSYGEWSGAKHEVNVNKFGGVGDCATATASVRIGIYEFELKSDNISRARELRGHPR